jgi:hypothetical protein
VVKDFTARSSPTSAFKMSVSKDESTGNYYPFCPAEAITTIARLIKSIEHLILPKVPMGELSAVSARASPTSAAGAGCGFWGVGFAGVW